MKQTEEVANRLCDLCREGKNLDAVRELYADDIVSIEAAEGDGGMPRRMEGKEQVLGKNQWWIDNHEVNDASVSGPHMHGENRFAVMYDYDITHKESGQRMKMQEVAVYTVEDGKVAKEEFYYTM